MRTPKQILTDMKDNQKEYIILFLFSFLAAILAIFLAWVLNYFNFYVHELGHANSAILYTMMRHEQNTTINFSYYPYPVLFTNSIIKVPQQTTAIMPKIMLTYGILFSMIFYAIIFLLLARIKLIKKNKWLEGSLGLSFLILILSNLILNLFCETDGFNFDCGVLKNIIGTISFYALILSLGFFLALLILKFRNRRIKNGNR